MQIQFVNLNEQYQKIKQEIDSAISDVLASTAFIQGAPVKAFEKELAAYNTVNHCISCGNGTDALQIAFMALDLKPGDEVIFPSFTYVASVEAAALLGIKPVLVDSDPTTFNIDSLAITKAITSKTKAIVPVHLFGQCSDMEEIIKVAKQHNLYIIEDTAQAIGAEYLFADGIKSKAGSMGHIGTTSFFPSKNLGCYGDGGALFTNDEVLAKKIRMIANHGQEKKYHHDLIGVNSRLDTIQASILRVKLKYLDNYILARQKAAEHYDRALDKNENFSIPYIDPSSSHVFHQYTLTLKADIRQELVQHLEKQGIPTMIYYPIPVHLQKGYTHLGYKKGDFPIAEMLSERVLSLPMHTELSEDQLAYISKNMVSFN